MATSNDWSLHTVYINISELRGQENREKVGEKAPNLYLKKKKNTDKMHPKVDMPDESHFDNERDRHLCFRDQTSQRRQKE